MEHQLDGVEKFAWETINAMKGGQQAMPRNRQDSSSIYSTPVGNGGFSQFVRRTTNVRDNAGDNTMQELLRSLTEIKESQLKKDTEFGQKLDGISTRLDGIECKLGNLERMESPEPQRKYVQTMGQDVSLIDIRGQLSSFYGRFDGIHNRLNNLLVQTNQRPVSPVTLQVIQVHLTGQISQISQPRSSSSFRLPPLTNSESPSTTSTVPTEKPELFQDFAGTGATLQPDESSAAKTERKSGQSTTASIFGSAAPSTPFSSLFSNQPSSAEQDPESDSGDQADETSEAVPDGEYIVERIEDRRVLPKVGGRKKKIVQYLIKWKGYDKATWEKEENLTHCLDLLREYKENRTPRGGNNGASIRTSKRASSRSAGSARKTSV